MSILAQSIIGWIASAVQMSGYTYQSGKLIKCKMTSSLSLFTFVVNFIGSGLWFLNAILLGLIQPGITNTVVLSAVSIIVFFILVNNLKWSKFKASLVLIGLLTIVWTMTVVQLIDLYSVSLVSEVPNWVKTIVVYLAAITTMASFVPQFIKMVRTHDTKHVSWILSISYGLSNFLWLTYYASLAGSEPIEILVPMLIAGAVTGSLQVAIVIMKWRNEKNHDEIDGPLALES